VYSGVADLVRERVRADAEAGDEQAAFILPLVDRKLVKQTVMTSVYGVTFIGARQQVRVDLFAVVTWLGIFLDTQIQTSYHSITQVHDDDASCLASQG